MPVGGASSRNTYASSQLDGNPLPIEAAALYYDSRSRLPELFAATTALSMIREPAVAICIGIQSLFLPALVTLEILDSAFANSIRMAAKWELIVTVKHWRQRRGMER